MTPLNLASGAARRRLLHGDAASDSRCARKRRDRSAARPPVPSIPEPAALATAIVEYAADRLAARLKLQLQSYRIVLQVPTVSDGTDPRVREHPEFAP